MVTDRREYIRLDVGYFDNPKVAEVLDESPLAVALHIASMAHARQHRTDGVVSRKQLLRKVGAAETDAKLLLDLGLWHDLGDGKVEVHDYAKHQETREEIEARSEAQRKNARKRWDNRRDTSRNADGTFHATGTPDGNATGNARGNAEDSRGEERKEDGGRPPSAGAREVKSSGLDVQGALAAAGLPPNDHETFLQALRDGGVKRPPGFVMKAHHDGTLESRIKEWQDEQMRDAKAPRVIAPNVTPTKRGEDGRPVAELCEHDFEVGRCPTCRRSAS